MISRNRSDRADTPFDRVVRSAVRESVRDAEPSPHLRDALLKAAAGCQRRSDARDAALERHWMVGSVDSLLMDRHAGGGSFATVHMTTMFVLHSPCFRFLLGA
jgi:hypothetical protein